MTQPDRDVRPLEEWLGFLLNRAAMLVRERTYAELRELDLPPRALGLMLVIAEEGGVIQSSAAARLGMDRTTTSQLADDLVRIGFVSRRPDPMDRRSNRLELTDKGRRCKRKASARALAVEQAVVSAIDEGELALLKAILTKLLAAPGVQ